MHLKDEVLHAYLDDELSPESNKSTTLHIAVCPKCSSRLGELERRANRVTQHIQYLAPPSTQLSFSPHTALQTFDQRKDKPMSNLFRRPAWIVASLVIMLSLSLLITPVRALAGNFLGLFRVKQIQVISYDPAAIERFNNADTSDKLSAFFDQNLKTTRQGEFSKVTTKEEAAAFAGFTPRLPSDSEVNSLGVEPGQTIEINIDSAMMNVGLESFGFSDVKIPADLDGQKIVATVPSAVAASFGVCPGNDEQNVDPDSLATCMALMQLPAPTVSAPDNFPVVQVGEVILQVLGMSPEQAAAFSQSVDWSSTLILPVPTGGDVVTEDIQIDGVKGTVIHNNGNNQYALIWVKNGILYGLSGYGNLNPAFRLIATLD